MAAKLSRLFYKNTSISLGERENGLFLTIYYGETPEPFDEMLEKWPELSELSKFFPNPEASEALIGLDVLNRARDLLAALDKEYGKQGKLNLYTTHPVQAIEIADQPLADFGILYKFSRNMLTGFMSEGVRALENGWYRKGNVCWRYAQLTNEQVKDLRRPRIEQDQLVKFLSHDRPLFEKAGVRIDCDLHYNPLPAVELILERVERNEVRIRRKWNVTPESIDTKCVLKGHVLSDSVVRPGILSSALDLALPCIDDTARLFGMEIARFRDTVYPALKTWMTGNVSRFESLHAWIVPPYEWVLAASATHTHGIGKAYAHPTAIVGGEMLHFEAVRQMMCVPYTQLEKGWVRRSDLCVLGINDQGNTVEGNPIKSYKMNVSQVIRSGDTRMKGFWKSMRMSGIPWRASPVKQHAAREHLEYLLYWGINGGLTGGYEAAALYGMEILRSLSIIAPDCRILMTGTKTDLDEYERMATELRFMPVAEYKESSSNPICMAPYDKISQTSIVSMIPWDLMIFIEPDELYKTANTPMFMALEKVKSACRICFYHQPVFSWTGDRRAVQGAILGLRSDDPVLDVCIRDPRHPKALPDAYVFRPSALKAVPDPGIDVVIEREQTEDASAGGKLKLAIESAHIGQVRAGMGFFADARKYALLREEFAEHVPFSKKWPTYADMNSAQRKWYFYLRTAIRDGKTPDTDLSYLLVYIYELLGLIGVENPAKAYAQLLSIWCAYRGKYAMLDECMGEWIFDFINIYPCGVSSVEYLSQAPCVSEMALNCGLSARNRERPVLLARPALECLSGYAISRSKFCGSGYGAMIDKVLPRLITLVDSKLKETSIKGLLDQFNVGAGMEQSRSAFIDALVETRRGYSFSCIPYSDCQPVKELFQQIIRYAENALRKNANVSYRLRGITLGEPYASWIDIYLGKQTMRQSALLGDLQTIEMETDESGFGGMKRDLVTVQHILKSLGVMQRNILEHLKANGWEMEISRLKTACPGAAVEVELEEIDQIAFGLLGVHLIEYENTGCVVEEDYREELTYLLDHPDEDTAVEWTIDTAHMGAEWVKLFESMDIPVLAAALEGRGAIEQLAQARGDSLEHIIQTANSISMGIIGDNLIDGDTIAPEYRILIETHMVKKS